MMNATLRLLSIGLLCCTFANPTSGQAASKDAAPAAGNLADYTIGFEDRLRIFVWGEEELSLTAQVRPDGKITVPLADDVQVMGLTPEQVGQVITERLSKYVRDPHVTVIVEEIKSFRIYFIGEVRTTGPMQLYRPTRILQAIAQAGGPTEFAKKEIVLLRDEYGVERRIDIDYKKLVTGDVGQENIFLKPGDTLIFK